MQFKGKVWKFGSNIDTDVIIPARYLTRHDPESLARHCMEGVDPDFSGKCAPGDLIVADWNFGCGSSREHAPIAISGAGIRCVMAKSFARIFYRNGFNMGLPLLEVSEEVVDSIAQGDLVEVDIGTGSLINHTQEKRFLLPSVPPFMMDLLAAGGLIPYVRQKLIRQGRIPSGER